MEVDFEKDERLLNYHSTMKIPADKDQALAVLIEEVKRLNSVLNETRDSFYKLYTSLKQKNEKIKELEEKLQKLPSQYISQLNEKQETIKRLTSDIQFVREDLQKANDKNDLLHQDSKNQKDKILFLESELKRKDKDIEFGEERRLLIKKENESLVQNRNKILDEITKKDDRISQVINEQVRIREEADKKIYETKLVEVETRKELENQMAVNAYVKKKNEEIMIEKKKALADCAVKDDTIDRLKEELLAVSKLVSTIKQNVSNPVDFDFDRLMDTEVNRLKGLTMELKNAEVEVERYKIEGSLKDREFLKLKNQLREAIANRDSTLEQIDIVKTENKKLADQQDRFFEDIKEMRDIYESQLDSLSSKLSDVSDELLIQKEKNKQLLIDNQAISDRNKVY